MDLIDRYLKAVAAQLPKDDRDDIIAELRDLILSRFEAREEALGRPLTPEEQQSILRELGHPLIVAARYGKGPDTLVGPALYPWWLFGVKVGLILLAAVAVFGAAIQLALGEIRTATAFARALHDFINGSVMLIGLATIAGFILERQARRPAFIDKWRVEDLGLFEMASLDSDGVERALGPGKGSARAFGAGGVSPRGRALASAAWALVLLMWWTSALDIGGVTPRDVGGTVEGVDYGPIVVSLVNVLFWPITAYLGARILFDLARAWRPDDVRMVATGDFAFAALRLAGLVWLWQASALSPVIRVYGVDGLIERFRDVFDGGLALSAILTVAATAMTVEAGWTMAVSLYRLVTGRR